MTNKVIAWTWLITTILATLNWLTMTNEDNWFFVLVYMLGSIYIFIRYIESFGK
ncbi:MAG: hypothetical protein QXP66_03875 [Candidatus Aenigmatarchaeota archaeon]